MQTCTDEKRRGIFRQNSDGDGCFREEKQMKTKSEVDGQLHACPDKEGTIGRRGTLSSCLEKTVQSQ